MAEIRVKTFDDFRRTCKDSRCKWQIIICPESRYDFVFEADDASKMTQLNPRRSCGQWLSMKTVNIYGLAFIGESYGFCLHRSYGVRSDV